MEETPTTNDQAKKNVRDQLTAYAIGVGAGYMACRFMMREAVKATAIKSADLLLRDDGASVILIRFANGTVTTLVKKVAEDVVKI